MRYILTDVEGFELSYELCDLMGFIQDCFEAMNHGDEVIIRALEDDDE